MALAGGTPIPNFSTSFSNRCELPEIWEQDESLIQLKKRFFEVVFQSTSKPSIFGNVHFFLLDLYILLFFFMKIRGYPFSFSSRNFAHSLCAPCITMPCLSVMS
jgi:hypothetical protein